MTTTLSNLDGSVVYSRPYDELPLKTDKYAQSCATMHLASKGITHLIGFEKFSNLNTLFLNNNKLTNIEGLETNFRIKQLYLHNNRINSLQEECFAPFVFLNVLTLNGNLLDDLEGTIAQIKTLGHLKSVDLFDNPIAQEDNYRKRIICELSPSCEVLDRHAITDEERVEAKQFKIRMMQLQKLGTKKKNIKLPPTEEELQFQHQQQIKLENILRTVRKFLNDTRPNLEASWLIYDKRELGLITEDQFWEVLTQFGVKRLLTDEECTLLTSKYCTKTCIPSSFSPTRTVPFDSSKDGNRINYFKFCWDVVPKQLLMHQPTWRMEKVPDISVTAKDLKNYVNAATIRERETELLTRHKQLSGSAITAQQPQSDGNTRKGMEYKCLQHGLDPWSSAELSRIIAQYEPDTNASDAVLTVTQVKTILRKMMRFSLIPVIGISKVIEKLFIPLSLSSTSAADQSQDELTYATINDSNVKAISAVTLRAIFGCSTISPKCFAPITASTNASTAAVPKGKGKGAASSKTPDASAAAKPSARVEVTPSWILKWRALTTDEENNLNHKVSDNAAALLDKLLRLGPKDDNTSLMKDTLAVSVDLSRLNKSWNPSVSQQKLLSVHNSTFSSSFSFLKHGHGNSIALCMPQPDVNSRTGGTLCMTQPLLPSTTSSTVAATTSSTSSTNIKRSDLYYMPNLTNTVLPTTVDPTKHDKAKKKGKRKHRKEKSPSADNRHSHSR